MKSCSESYRRAGVDITAGYRAVELMKQYIARTMTENVLPGLGGFGGFSGHGRLQQGGREQIDDNATHGAPRLPARSVPC